MRGGGCEGVWVRDGLRAEEGGRRGGVWELGTVVRADAEVRLHGFGASLALPCALQPPACKPADRSQRHLRCS